MRVSEALLLDHLPSLIGWKDVNRRYLGANKALLAVKGLNSTDDIAGKTDEDLAPWSANENEIYQLQDLNVLNGSNVSTVHSDSTMNEVFILEKRPLTDKHNHVTGLIYHCSPYNKSEAFRILREIDNQLGLHTQHYALNDHPNKFKLTHREHECLFLLIRGKTAKEIGVLLSLSKRTIESYIENIKNKMDCRNKAEILVKAVLNGYHTHLPAGLHHEIIMSIA